MKKRLRLLLCVVLPALPHHAPCEEGDAIAVLNEESFWRVRTIWETEEIHLEDGSVGYKRIVVPPRYFYEHRKLAECKEYTVTNVPTVRLPAGTPHEWMQPDFDDSSWVRMRGPVLSGRYKPEPVHWKVILARGRFLVTDPAAVKTLKLSLAFKGGAVVYVNGREVKRSHMPSGAVTPETAALPYGRDAYLNDDGSLMGRPRSTAAIAALKAIRIRRADNITIPGTMLKKGVNVLAVGIHRAPTWYRFYTGHMQTSPIIHPDAIWNKCALVDLVLTAGVGNVEGIGSRKRQREGLLVWNQSILSKAFVEDEPDPFSPLRPIDLVGVRNGTFAGQLVVGGSGPIKGLRVTATDLTGPSTISADHVLVRYGLVDGEPRRRGAPPSFDSLDDVAPTNVPVHEAQGGSVQQLWVTVSVPRDAAAGDYAGKLAIAADGVPAVTVPLHLEVLDWTLPDSREFRSRMDIVESPESVAMAYGVEMWSDEHFVLLDRVFEHLAPLSCRTLYISAVRRTHFGNEHAMVRWVKDDDGNTTPDFGVVDRYLATAVKHLGKVPGVILYCWEPVYSMGHATGTGSSQRTSDKPIMYTLLNPETGKLRKRKGPAWGTPEAKEFWKKFNDGLTPVLQKHGLADSRLYGLLGDARATQQAMDDITTGFPDAKWAVHSHHYCVTWKGYEIGMAIAMWGIGCNPVDPFVGHGYGWKNPFWIMYYPREMSLSTSLVETRTKLENWMGALTKSASVYSKAIGSRGLGRLGADFFKVPDDSGRASYLCGRYPESYWGQMNLSYGVSHLLGKGTSGPVPTIRSEAFRENIQELEARISIEEALLDEAQRARLGDDLAARCRVLLDKRIRVCLHAHGPGLPWFVSSGWEERTEELYRLAGEVQKALD